MATDDIPPQAPFPASLLDRYLAGEATADERALVEQWRRAAPLHDGVTDVLHDRAWGADTNANHVEQGWRQIHARALAGQRAGSARPLAITSNSGRRVGLHALRQRTWTISIGLIAAALALVVTIPGVRMLPHGPTSPVPARLYRTALGQSTVITLADGSTMVLAPETRVRYSIDGHGVRTAELTGEAFFTITANAHQPFVVRTGAVTTRVLGTAFDVRHYIGDRATQVTVVTGRVATGGRTAPVTLAAGAVGHATDSSVIVSTVADPERSTSWIRGRLVFDDTPLYVILGALNRWYGYEFRLADTTLADRRVSVAFRTDRPAEALTMMKLILNVTMSFDGNVVTLRPEPSAVGAPSHPRIRELLRKPDLEVGK